MENPQGFRPAWNSLNRRNKIIMLVIVSMIACVCLGTGALMAPTTEEDPATKADIAKSVEATVSAVPTAEPQVIEKTVKEAASEADVAKAVEATLSAMPTSQTEVTEKIIEVTVIVAKEVIVTPTPEPTPEVEPTPEAEQWVEIKRWEGSGLKTTEPFTIQGDQWRTVWTNHQGDSIFQIMLYRDGDLYLGQPLLANTTEKGSDTSYVYDGGTFHLVINAISQWTVIVEEKR